MGLSPFFEIVDDRSQYIDELIHQDKINFTSRSSYPIDQAHTLWDSNFRNVDDIDPV